jgi:hypothetical protein
MIDHIDGRTNTPADDNWTLQIEYIISTEFKKNTCNITFSFNGEIDLQNTGIANLNLANQLFSPTIKLLEQLDHKFNFWKMVNSVFVSFYWTALLDVGSVSPTTYTQQDFLVNFSSATTHPSTNNIFLNSTLFDSYATYWRTSLLPALNWSLPNLPNQTLSDQEVVTFSRSYNCLQRRLKAPINLVVSVIAANYVLIMGGYTVFLAVAMSLEKCRRRDG